MNINECGCRPYGWLGLDGDRCIRVIPPTVWSQGGACSGGGATDTIYIFPCNGMIQPGCVLVSLLPPSPAVLLADPQWTSSDEHTCSRMKTTSPYGYAGSLRGTCPARAQTSNWHSETQISSSEFSPSCHHVAR